MRARLIAGMWTAGLLAVMAAWTARGLAEGAVSVTASAEIDGKRYDYSGPGECYYTASGSIYEAPATMWHAMFRARGNAWSSANLAIWQLKGSGAVRLNLSAMAGGGTYSISTAQSGAAKGTAIGGAQNQAAGGRLTVEGKTAEGRTVKIAISCSRFAAPEDNG